MPAARSNAIIARAGQVFIVTFDIDFTGNYAVGGEVLDLANVIPWFTGKAPSFVDFNGLTGAEYKWQPSTQKIKGLTAAGVEFTVAAYPEAKIKGIAFYMPVGF